MRILLSYPSEHDQGEGQHVHRVLERLGHTVVLCNVARGISTDGHVSRRTVQGFAESVSIEELTRACGAIDLFLYVEPFGSVPRGLDRAPFPTACIIGDVHRSLPPRVRLARFFDHVFLYQRNYLRAFTDHAAGHVHWLPYACDLEFFRDRAVPRDLDVAFVGKLDGRRHGVMETLRRRWRVNDTRYYLQREIPDVYSRARIVVNLPVGGDLAFRFFEALSCGAMLLTERLDNGQEDLFKEGEHYAAFAHERELFDAVEYYLTHEAERSVIAEAGHREVCARHSLDERLAGLLRTIEASRAPAAPIRRLTGAEVDGHYAWLYEYWGSVDASLGLLAEARAAGRPWLRLSLAAAKAFARRLYRAVK